MGMEKTYVMLKPDCVKRGLMGQVISRIENKGYRITEAKMMTLDEAILREHYAHIADFPFFPEVLRFMTSGPVLAMVVEGENAVKGVRGLMGATKVEDAAAGTIRGDFAFCTSENIIHGADSIDSAMIEIERFFGVSHT
jgi:nucleoside-diphosphate kinase